MSKSRLLLVVLASVLAFAICSSAVNVDESEFFLDEVEVDGANCFVLRNRGGSLLEAEEEITAAGRFFANDPRIHRTCKPHFSSSKAASLLVHVKAAIARLQAKSKLTHVTKAQARIATRLERLKEQAVRLQKNIVTARIESQNDALRRSRRDAERAARFAQKLQRQIQELKAKIKNQQLQHNHQKPVSKKSGNWVKLTPVSVGSPTSVTYTSVTPRLQQHSADSSTSSEFSVTPVRFDDKTGRALTLPSHSSSSQSPASASAAAPAAEHLDLAQLLARARGLKLRAAALTKQHRELKAQLQAALNKKDAVLVAKLRKQIQTIRQRFQQTRREFHRLRQQRQAAELQHGHADTKPAAAASQVQQYSQQHAEQHVSSSSSQETHQHEKSSSASSTVSAHEQKVVSDEEHRLKALEHQLHHIQQVVTQAKAKVHAAQSKVDLLRAKQAELKAKSLTLHVATLRRRSFEARQRGQDALADRLDTKIDATEAAAQRARDRAAQIKADALVAATSAGTPFWQERVSALRKQIRALHLTLRSGSLSKADKQKAQHRLSHLGGELRTARSHLQAARQAATPEGAAERALRLRAELSRLHVEISRLRKKQPQTAAVVAKLEQLRARVKDLKAQKALAEKRAGPQVIKAVQKLLEVKKKIKKLETQAHTLSEGLKSGIYSAIGPHEHEKALQRAAALQSKIQSASTVAKRQQTVVAKAVQKQAIKLEGPDMKLIKVHPPSKLVDAARVKPRVATAVHKVEVELVRVQPPVGQSQEQPKQHQNEVVLTRVRPPQSSGKTSVAQRPGHVLNGGKDSNKVTYTWVIPKEAIRAGKLHLVKSSQLIGNGGKSSGCWRVHDQQGRVVDTDKGIANALKYLKSLESVGIQKLVAKHPLCQASFPYTLAYSPRDFPYTLSFAATHQQHHRM